MNTLFCGASPTWRHLGWDRWTGESWRWIGGAWDARGVELLAACCLVLLLGAVVGAAEPIKGVVSQVTLYRGQALVTRVLKIEGPKGPQEVVVGELPEQIQGEGVFAEGGQQLEVRAVRFRSRAVGQEPREEVRKLDVALAELAQKLALNAANQDIVAKRNAYLDQLEGFVAPTAKVELSKGVLNAEALQKITEFSFAQRQTNAGEIVKLGKERQEIEEQMNLISRQRAEITSTSTRTVREAVLFVNKLVAEPIEARLNYVVGNCGWSPSYTLRAGKNGESVGVEYNALIQQMSGEDWNDVTLTLSTASPALSASSPGLAPFRVALRAGQPSQQPGKADEVLSQAQQIRGRQQQEAFNYGNTLKSGENRDANWRLNTAANDLQNLELEAVAGNLGALREGLSVGDQGPSLSYRLAGAVSLSSRSDQQMARILQADLPSKFYYVASPVLTNHVYREAELHNNSQEDLLAGPITVYLDGRFVGQAEAPTVARGETFIVGFGAESQLRARRELVSKTDGVQGGNRELKFTYRLTVENFKDQPTMLRLYDRLPTTDRPGEIRVTLAKPAVALSEDKLYLRQEAPKGILRWDAQAPAKAAGETAFILEFSYTMEYDRNFQLTAVGADGLLQEEFEQLQRSRSKR